MGEIMNTLVVFAHHEAASFNAAMKDQAVAVLSARGHQVMVSDLYAMNFEPLAQRSDFTELSGTEPMNYLMEQRNASAKNAFSEDIKAEMDKVRWAETIIFQCPIWWFSVPAILKGWFDRVLATGFSWDFGKNYDQGLLRGKKALLSVTTGGSGPMYESTGINGDIHQMLFPVHHGVLYFCGMTVLEPFIAYAAFQAGDEGRKKYLEQYKEVLEHLDSRAVIAYRPHADFDDSGRLK
jgi:NAD(P)H dehydrogenase (quinone)